MFPGAEGLIGREFGGYRLERMLGSGGTGSVFLGRRADAPQDQAAVKVLIPPMQLGAADQAEFRARFRREAQTLQQLQHPHILVVRAMGEDEATGLPYMLLPYIDGGTLATRIAQGPLSLAEASRYLAQVADALDYAHAHSIVHRDIKPANILLDQQGYIYLADFGLVKLFDGTRTTLTTAGQVMGTPEYMSPEQARGEQVGPAADTYSLGVVLYQMVTGRLPFQAKSLTDMLLQIVQSAPPPPRDLRPDLPEPVNMTILRALAKRPEDRFASAGDLSRAFNLGTRGEWAVGLQPQPAAPTPTMPVILPPTVAAPPSELPRTVGAQDMPPFMPAPVQPWPAPAANAGPTLQASQVPAQPAGQGMMPPVYDPRLGQLAAPLPGATPYAGGNGNRQGVPPPAARRTRGSGASRIALYLLAALVVLSLSGVGIYLHANGSQGSGSLGGGGGSPNAPSATHTPSVANQHFKIATELPVSGPDASIGLPTQYGVDFAVSQNTDLGNGNTITVMHENDESSAGADPSIGAANIQQLIADPAVMGIVGPFNSGVAIAEIPLVTAASLVEISPSNTIAGLTEQQNAERYGLDYTHMHPSGYKEAYFRITAPDDKQGSAEAKVAFSMLDAHSAYVVDDSTAYGKNLADFFAQDYTNDGGSVLGRTSISSQSSFGSVAQSIAATHPAVVFYGGVTYGGGAQLKKALAGAGYSGPMLGGDGIAEDPAWTQIAGSAATNTYATVAAPDTSVIPSSFASAYNSFAAGKPNNSLGPYTVMAYDAAMVEITAIKNLLAAGTPVTRANVRDMVAKSSIKSALGGNATIAFDANGDNTNPIISVYQTDSSGNWVYKGQESV